MKIKVEQDEAHRMMNDGELIFAKINGKIVSVKAPFTKRKEELNVVE